MDILSQLKPCPFCGSRAIFVADLSLHCHNCGAKGPSGLSVAQALILWNVRLAKPGSASETESLYNDSETEDTLED